MAVSPTIELSELLGGLDNFVQLVKQNQHVIVTSHGSFLILVHSIDSLDEAKVEVWKAYRRGASACPMVPPYEVTPIEDFWSDLLDKIVRITSERKAVAVLTKDGVPIMVLQNFRFAVRRPIRETITAGVQRLRNRYDQSGQSKP